MGGEPPEDIPDRTQQEDDIPFWVQ
jgi:hypothetical protein